MKGDNEAELGSGMAPYMSKEQQDVVLLSLNACADVGRVLTMCRTARLTSVAISNEEEPVRADMMALSRLLSELQAAITAHGERVFEISRKVEGLQCQKTEVAATVNEAADRLH